MSRGVLFLFGWLSLVSFCLPLSVGALERPPLDRNAPEKTEVALFALG